MTKSKTSELLVLVALGMTEYITGCTGLTGAIVNITGQQCL